MAEGGERNRGREYKNQLKLSSFFLFFFLLLSDAEHQQADWVGIHERICQLLVPIRTLTPLSFQRDSRIEMQLKKVRVNVMH